MRGEEVTSADRDDERPSPWRSLTARGFDLYVELLFLLGFVTRIRPIFFPDPEMFRSFPTEDGYLMLTVARNMALGLGMTSAAGTMPTNGVQPLAAFVQALCFRIVDGDRATGLRILLVVYTLIAALTAFFVYRLGLRMMGSSPEGRHAALLGAAVWFISPAILFHTMNMLETGLYAAFVAGAALFFTAGHQGGSVSWPWRRCLAMGALLGLAFWARNDAVFLMLAVGVAHLATRAAGVSLARRIAETSAMAAAAAALGLPWVIHGYRAFGSIVPVSGQAYLGSRDALEALRAAAVALFEHVTLLVSFEHDPLQHNAIFVIICGAVVALAGAGGIAALSRARITPAERAPLLAPALFGAGLLVFYVFFFNGSHFLRRYLSALSPWLALLWGYAVWALWRRIRSTRFALAGPLFLLLLLANFVARDGLFVQGPWHRGVFFRSVEWIEKNVPEQAWVGAFQSGTMGFFHDRTINMDGKLNPAALAAIRADTHHQWVVDSPIQFVADWASIVVPWAESDPIIHRNFGWSIRDEERNFAVLRRRAAHPEPALP